MILIVAPPSNGTLSVDGFGNLVYTPNPGFFGTDTISYRADDGSLTSNMAVIQINVSAGPSGGGDDPDPIPIPDPTPDPDPVDDDGDDDPVDEDDGDGQAGSSTTITTAAETQEQISVGVSRDEPIDQVSVAREIEDRPLTEVIEYYLGQPRLLGASLGRSLELEMFGRLLQLDLEQAIVWQQWDQLQQGEETATSFYVGTAGIAAGMFSIGYVFWALRGGAFVAAITSTLPSWRLVDPATLLSAYRASKSIANDRVEKMLS